MRVAATFLLSVTVFTALFLESATNPLESAADLDVANTLTVALAPIESAIATVAALREEVRTAVDAAAASIKVNLNTKLLVTALQDLVSTSIESSDALLANVLKSANEGLAKTKDEVEKEVLTALIEWLGEFEGTSSEVHADIEAAVASGTKEALESVIPTVSNVIDVTVEQVAVQVEILAATPGKRVRTVREVLESDFAVLVANANVVLGGLEIAVEAW